jgi:hypothetical protein
LTGSQILGGQWHHVFFVYDGVNEKIYVNGQLDVSTPLAANVNLGIANITLGNSYVLDKPFNGTIDEIKIFNKTLSANKIKALYELDLS